jgi:hypothetical protein
MKQTSHDAIKALAKRHREDMFFTEVKDGATQSRRNHARIDALAIRISWASPLITGYEVKVSRSDFIQDNKWMAYLNMCNQLFWVAPPGVIDLSEVPESCGLLTLTDKGGLRAAKKAPYREIPEPVGMYKYLMFKHIGPYGETDAGFPRCYQTLTRDERVARYKDYLETLKESKEIGNDIARVFGKFARDTQRLHKEALREHENIAELREFKNGIVEALHPVYPLDVKTCRGRISELKAGGTPAGMKTAIDRIKNLVETLERMVETTDGNA